MSAWPWTRCRRLFGTSCNIDKPKQLANDVECAFSLLCRVITGDIPRHPGNVRLQHSGEHQRDDPQASVLSHKYQHLLQVLLVFFSVHRFGADQKNR